MSHEANIQCFYCNKVTVQFTCSKRTPTPPANMRTRDHIHPIIRGGKGLMNNTVIACTKCNQDKSGLTLDEYRMVCAYRAGQVARVSFRFPGEQSGT